MDGKLSLYLTQLLHPCFLLSPFHCRMFSSSSKAIRLFTDSFLAIQH